MKILGLLKNAQVFKISLAIAIVVVLYTASQFYSQMQKLNATIEVIANSDETKHELENLLSVISNYETSLRSFIITKDENYIENRFLSRGKIERSIEKLKELTVNNSSRNEDIDRLKKIIDQRFTLFRETLIVAKSKNDNRLALNAKMLESSEVTEEMKSFISKIVFSESVKKELQNDSHQFQLNDLIITAFLLVIITLLFLFLSFNKMNVDIAELQKANDKLKILNKSYNTAEMTAGFGHWMLNIETNTYTFSDNLYRLMGVEPNAFEANSENTKAFIHPEDVEYVTKIHEDSLISHETTTMIYRFLTAKGEVKQIMAVGSFTTDGNGDTFKIGVNYDITSQYNKTLELENNNKELEYINAELESFNNIVSHDLQEPLRKIQIFISRIEDKEQHLLTQQGKDYFCKVRTAANRMQTLLMDMVNYSRTIKGDKIFAAADLNSIVEEIILDLSSNIEEKKAEILIGKLPTLIAIPFQIKQLFINLISNSLNYSREDVIPQIRISSKKVTEKEMLKYQISNKKEYHKIVISDNGIGFKQEYAEKIFLLFKRLETDSKYSGTGLGLAICSKIVDNHKGFIKVKSTPNLGTKFYIFFPKIDLEQ